jgi:protein-disulfide isomerase
MELSRKRRNGQIGALILAGAGLLLSAELLRIHITVGTDPGHAFSCQISQQISCNAVALSRQAVLLDVPVPVWGILTYLLFGTLAIVGLKSKSFPAQNAGDYLLPLAAWSVAYSAYLAYVAAFVLKTLCLFCAGLYAVNLGLLIAAAFAAAPLRGFGARRREEFARLRRDPTMMGILAGGLVLALAAAVVLYYRSQRLILTPVPGISLDLSGDPMIGPYRAPITIVEFSDFECPACRNMHPNIQALLGLYPGAIRIIHKNFPLSPECNPNVKFQIHEHACAAAAAAECAFKMGKFEAYSSALWVSKDLSLTGLLILARDNGLDTAAFQECMNSDDTRRKILADVEAGAKVEVTATPTFIVNGYKFSGYEELPYCRKIIDTFLSGKKLPPDAQPIELPGKN